MQDRHTKEQTIVEQRNGKTGAVINKYLKGRYLGKGGFAKCYEFINTATNRKYAAKIIEKATLTRSKAKEKLASEIDIHKSVRSAYVVKYQGCFQDAVNVYILLELCTNQTMNQLIKRRKRITQLQMRYYMRQIALAVRDFQAQMIIHRDLKLGNLLLTDNLQIRISDFGLAAKLAFPGERRKTMCGTPNYIAPQILQNATNGGHSFEVDIWSMGVIAYACVVGRPPFQTSDVKTTYGRIKMCNYSFPDNITLTHNTKNFINRMLQKDPRHRVNIEELLNDQFFTAASIPECMPMTTLACPPNAAFLLKYNPQAVSGQLKHKESGGSQKTDRALQKQKQRQDSTRVLVRTNSIDQIIKNPYCQRAASTAALTRARLTSKVVPERVAVGQSEGAAVWVSFFEENAKFGVSYLLNSNATGMKFNDSTCLISNVGFTRMKYMDILKGKEGVEVKDKGDYKEERQGEVFGVESVPDQLAKKFKIITYYQKQLRLKKEKYECALSNEQIIARQRFRHRQTPESALAMFVIKHYRSSKANFFWFSNKSYQVIFQDYTELLFQRKGVTYVNKVGERRCFREDEIDGEGEEVKKRVRYVINSIQTLRESKGKTDNKENKPEEAEKTQGMLRSSSTFKIEKQKPSILRGSASTSRIGSNCRVVK